MRFAITKKIRITAAPDQDEKETVTGAPRSFRPQTKSKGKQARINRPKITVSTFANICFLSICRFFVFFTPV